MKREQLQAKLLTAARLQTPGDEVPHAFQQRVMARLRALTVEDVWSFWGRELSRAAAVSVVFAVALSAWSYLRSADTETATLENTVLAAAEEFTDTW